LFSINTVELDFHRYSVFDSRKFVLLLEKQLSRYPIKQINTI
jgi:hypothetical protein